MSFLTRTRLPPRAFTRSFSASQASRVAKVTIVGRLGAQPELITGSNGQEMVRYSVATNHGSSENRQTSWWKVACFQENSKERMLNIPKGSLVYIDGEMRFRKLEKDGQEQSILSITQNNIQVLQRGSSEGSEVPEASETAGSS